MSYRYVIESSAWVEYFGGTPKGEQLKEIIETELIATSLLAIAELADKAEREQQPFDNVLQFIQSKATILPLTVPIVLSAAKLKKQLRRQNPKFGLADAIHLATAVLHSAPLLTADNDFRGAENVIFI